MTFPRMIVLAIALLGASLAYVSDTARADDFVDDVYYLPSADRLPLNEDEPLRPVYNKNAREIVFVEDTTTLQPDSTHYTNN